ncbi:MAG: DUF1565 domain-containing protein [Kiritimatiellae bacterium]|nr:DUF1565 domain-containing protein [Kiritimatiellia bacterium]
MKRRFGVLLSFLFVLGGATHAADYCVATNAIPEFPYNTWGTGFTNIQQALNTATNGDAIHLAGQRFVLTSQLVWTNSGVTVYGGYQATGSFPGGNDPAQWPTTLAMDPLASNRVWSIQGVTNGTLQNLTITGGICTNRGGGLYIVNASNLTIASCAITNNLTFGGMNSYGGGLYATDSYLVLTNDVFLYNDARQTKNEHGGYIYGGGVYVYGGSCEIVDSVLARNRISGLLYSQAYGVGAFLKSCAYSIRNCLIAVNTCDSWNPYSYPAILGVYAVNSIGTFQNCTFIQNFPRGLQQDGGTMTVKDSIFWANGDDIKGTVTLMNCDIQDGDGNGVNGSFSADPLFDRGLYLATNSPCIDAGSANVSSLGLDARTTRADGAKDTGTVDLGYHPASGFASTVADLYVSPTGSDGSATPTNPLTPYRSITKALSTALDGTRIHIAAGRYTNGVETFPLSMNRWGLQLIGTNRDTTVISAAGSGQRVLNVDRVLGDGRLEGLTFTGGANSLSVGGGIYANLSDLAIQSCVISSNKIYIVATSSTAKGGGLFTIYCTTSLRDCRVEGNLAHATGAATKVHGGGICSLFGDLSIAETVIAGNVARCGGPYYGSSLTRGGGLRLHGVAARISNCLISANDARDDGDANFGDGVFCGLGDETWPITETVSFSNCTIATNSGVGLAAQSGSTVSIQDSILWGNSDDVTGTVSLAYCDIEDGDNNGTNGCISLDPLFVNPPAGDYHLSSSAGHWTPGGWVRDPRSSPCIDAGDKNSPYANEPQPNGDRLNLGAYGNTWQASKTTAKGTLLMLR